MLRLLTLVVCLLTGCTLGAPSPVPQAASPGPDDLSTWGTPEILAEPPGRSRPRPVAQADPKPTPAEKVYAFVPGGTYTVPVGLGAPLDIQFQPGEAVHNAIDGDRHPITDGQETSGQRTCQRWCLEQGTSGAGEAKRGHIFVTVTEAGLKNGLTITTTRGVYAVTLESVKASPIRYLRWTHAPGPVEVVDMEPITPGPLPRLDVPSKFRVGYQAKASQAPLPDWMPRQTIDDGKKVYVIFPEAVLFGVVPLLRVLGPNGPMPVNARQYLNVLIVDQLFARAELRVGTGETAEVVTIERGTLRLVECPADQEACPRWPAAAYRLQGGQS